ncbi:hypothetical protein CAPTEDRAFT_222352 [Capitella teleta]|uniref:Uncharacterized protein n=1 Tax=Capitella teleta TaxID=283909 RepID=R7U764_CAPTE|nr:hypothetical protein CAPTEDRAFT_222352 [Capitella teleta]|eukprot:ELT99516.1 hypothetical protein CAPTEDRAFT_222352 [Capitella teleta]
MKRAYTAAAAIATGSIFHGDGSSRLRSAFPHWSHHDIHSRLLSDAVPSPLIRSAPYPPGLLSDSCGIKITPDPLQSPYKPPSIGSRIWKPVATKTMSFGHSRFHPFPERVVFIFCFQYCESDLIQIN